MLLQTEAVEIETSSPRCLLKTCDSRSTELISAPWAVSTLVRLKANLREVFDAAEDAESILFFEEADALFGKGSEVKDSHDRYANIEWNFLLQRMESFKGLPLSPPTSARI